MNLVRTRARLIAVILSGVSVTALAGQGPAAQPRGNAFAPPGTPIAIALAGYAKVLCSAVFVTGREPAEAFENSGFFLFPEDQRRGVT
jgi:hypothetical protein